MRVNPYHLKPTEELILTACKREVLYNCWDKGKSTIISRNVWDITNLYKADDILRNFPKAYFLTRFFGVVLKLRVQGQKRNQRKKTAKKQCLKRYGETLNDHGCSLLPVEMRTDFPFQYCQKACLGKMPNSAQPKSQPTDYYKMIFLLRLFLGNRLIQNRR